MYLFFYTALFSTAMIKFSIKRKLCTYTNLKIIMVSVLVVIPLSSMVERIDKKYKAIESIIQPNEQSCLAINSPMTVFSKVLKDSYELTCSKQCPCSGNPMLYKNDPRVEIINVDEEKATIHMCESDP
jgi:hypothetical protein